MILDHTGKPFKKAATPGFSDSFSSIWRAYSSYVGALYGLDQESLVRAREPITNHVWVYAAAMAIATNIGQAEFTMYRETDEMLNMRQTSVQAKGYDWMGPRAREKRRAVQRHLENPIRFRGRRIKGLDEDLEHPLMDLFYRPNDVMTSMSEAWQATWLWMTIRGECMWVLQRKDGMPLAPGEQPQEIWPMSPDLFEPLFRDNRLVAWSYHVSRGVGHKEGSKIILQLHEVVQFKYTNPLNTIRGMCPLIAAAGGIHLDMLSIDWNRAVLMNGAEPGGVLIADEGFSFDDKEKEDEFMTKWEQRHKGAQNKRRTAILTGMKYVPTGLSHQDMDWIEQRKWDRDEVLAVLNVPKSILSITDGLNYATQLSQDFNFWDKNLLPKIKYSERVIDSTLLFNQPDNVMAAFNLSKVQALKAGAAQQIAAANVMTQPGLHAPPAVAYETVGLEVPEYEGSDACLISGGLQTVESVLNPVATESVPGIPPGTQPVDPTTGESMPVAPTQQPAVEPPGAPPAQAPIKVAVQRFVAGIWKAKRVGTWRDLIRSVQAPAEDNMRSLWRGWVLAEKQDALEAFDKWARKTGYKNVLWVVSKETEDFEAMFPPIETSKKKLRTKMRPAYQRELKSAYEYTVKELGGIPLFELDSPQIVAAIEHREDILVGSAPKTMQNNMRTSIRKGIENGETVQQLRDRVSRTYNVAASSGKALTVARTESAGFMNESRQAMFKAQGIIEEEWTTAEDEHVRTSHVQYGEAGAKPRGFNYLTLAGGGGTLEFPGDSRAPAGEVINCRCCMIPVL